MATTLFACLLLASVSLCFAETEVSGLHGACKTGKYPTFDVDLTKFLGTWYEIAHSASFYWDKGCYCTQAVYSVSSSAPGLFQVANSCLLDGPQGREYARGAYATKAKRPGPGRFDIHFGPLASAPYDIVWTDYEVVLIASCSAIPVFGGSNVWILSKNPNLSNATYNAVVQRARDAGFDLSDLVLTHRDGCKPGPIPPPNPSIDGCYIQPAPMRNFDMQKYFGTWYIIMQRADWIEDIFTHDCECTTTETTPIPGVQGHYSNVVSCIKISDPTGPRYRNNLTLREITPQLSSSGIYNIRNFNLWNEHWQVLDVAPDYNSALLYNCFSLLDIPTYCWYVLSKTPTLDDKSVKYFLNKAHEFGLTFETVKTIPQNCAR